MPRGQSTEVDAYIFIKENLKAVGWDIRNPTRHPTGQVYTQNECHSHEELHRFLVQDTPENVVKVTESVFWVIEAKRENRLLSQALNEAEDYARKINESQIIKVKFITGVAGNDNENYTVKTKYFKGNEFKTVIHDFRINQICHHPKLDHIYIG